jgi:antitoxin (DNA-binding transcriptional repressor) of toxin-antitoxin stability system
MDRGGTLPAMEDSTPDLVKRVQLGIDIVTDIAKLGLTIAELIALLAQDPNSTNGQAEPSTREGRNSPTPKPSPARFSY